MFVFSVLEDIEPFLQEDKKVDINKFADVFLLWVKMAKQLSVNEWKYFFEKYEKHRSGELTKKFFLNEMMKIKNVKHIFCT